MTTQEINKIVNRVYNAIDAAYAAEKSAAARIRAEADYPITGWAFCFELDAVEGRDMVDQFITRLQAGEPLDTIVDEFDDSRVHAALGGVTLSCLLAEGE